MMNQLHDLASQTNYKTTYFTTNNEAQSSCTVQKHSRESPHKEVSSNVDKPLSLILNVLKVLGVVKLRGRLGAVVILVTSALMWVPVVFLSVCMKKADRIMASPSGLPTLLLFIGMAVSQLFGVRYETKHYSVLIDNIKLSLKRGNLQRNALILLGTSLVLHAVYLGLVLHLYLRQSIPVPWIEITFVYLLGYGYCSLVCVAMNIIFSAVCTSIRIKILDLKELLRNWEQGLSEALDEYNTLCDFIHCQVEAIKWWILCNLICFVIIWIADFHLWQFLASSTSHNVIHLVLYNCSCPEGYTSNGIHVPVKLLTGCEVLFSFLVFFLLTSPLYWAALVTRECNKFKEWVNKLQIQTDDKPLGEFSITTLDFFINRVQMASYFAFRLFGVNITKVLYSLTGLMTTVQVVLSVITNKLLKF